MPITLFNASVFKALAWRERSGFLKIKSLDPTPHSQVQQWFQADAEAMPDAHPEGRPDIFSRIPTTSFLTAATLIYAIGAGITAAAGTRLALQWVLVKGFKLYSFQLRDL